MFYVVPQIIIDHKVNDGSLLVVNSCHTYICMSSLAVPY